MKLLKNIGIVFLLIVFICSVLFVPQTISWQKEEEKEVLLGKDKYDSTVDIFDITEQEQHTYVANLYIRCGFIQHEDPVSTGNTEHDDNLITTPAEEKLIDVPAICQYPELPTGCESVAATMVLC